MHEDPVQETRHCKATTPEDMYTHRESLDTIYDVLTTGCWRGGCGVWEVFGGERGGEWAVRCLL